MLRTVTALIFAATVIALAGCSSGSGYSDLDRDATSTDVLPSDLPAYASEDHVEGSVRLVGEFEGVEYYLLRKDDFADICVVVYRSAVDWIGGCGGPNGSFGISGSGLDIFVAPDGSPILEDGTKVGANIVVR